MATLLPCDVAAGRRRVNVVSAASRMAAKPGETVDVLAAGFLKVTHADRHRLACGPARLPAF